MWQWDIETLYVTTDTWQVPLIFVQVNGYNFKDVE